LAERTSKLNISEEEKLKSLFRKIVCRVPSEKESKMLLAYYQKEKKKFGSNIENANNYLQAGEYVKAQNKNPTETAALMQVNHMLFNLDETTIK
jgi:putative IMPACT (imprinted ancient) family translation regulator